MRLLQMRCQRARHVGEVEQPVAGIAQAAQQLDGGPDRRQLGRHRVDHRRHLVGVQTGLRHQPLDELGAFDGASVVAAPGAAVTLEKIALQRLRAGLVMRALRQHTRQQGGRLPLEHHGAEIEDQVFHIKTG